MFAQIISAAALSPAAIWRKLPDRERELLWLTYELGMSCEDAAKAMDMPVDAARACLRRARRRFAQSDGQRPGHRRHSEGA